ncbi:hypothetical protein PanWU01x14_292250 [Parasponia andersonii]|uniref:Uncharacterized protein n=1 Tax=Parasponia andersonii TaxID=3476 RepID=A0A2P5AX75_PARAD|nr:hypothetical protein PanWU01x14_292250 [Parasponia andersonii]
MEIGILPPYILLLEGTINKKSPYGPHELGKSTGRIRIGVADPLPVGMKPLLLESCVVGTTLSYCVPPAKRDLLSNSPAKFCFTYSNVIISFFGSTVTSYCD